MNENNNSFSSFHLSLSTLSLLIKYSPSFHTSLLLCTNHNLSYHFQALGKGCATVDLSYPATWHPFLFLPCFSLKTIKYLRGTLQEKSPLPHRISPYVHQDALPESHLLVHPITFFSNVIPKSPYEVLPRSPGSSLLTLQ